MRAKPKGSHRAQETRGWAAAGNLLPTHAWAIPVSTRKRVCQEMRRRNELPRLWEEGRIQGREPQSKEARTGTMLRTQYEYLFFLLNLNIMVIRLFILYKVCF